MQIKEGIVICDTNMKKEILSNTNGLLDYTFLSIGELKTKLFGSLKKKAIFMLMDKYSITYEMALECIKYIPYVMDKEYLSSKLDSLVAMKKYVIDNDLLDVDKFFISKLKNNCVTFINPVVDKMYERIVSILKEYTEVFVINTTQTIYSPKVYVYKDTYEEALGVITKIYKLHKDGVSYNNIYLLNTNNYEFVLSRLSKSFNVPIDLKVSKNINSLVEAKKFLNSLDDCSTFEEALDSVKKESIVYNKVLSIVNDYELAKEEPKKYKDFFYKSFKNTKYSKKLFEEMVNTDGLSFSDSDYVFYLGINLGSVPSVYKDDEYLSDSELEMLGLNTSVEKNKLANLEFERIATTTKNIHLSYKENNSEGSTLPSNIIDTLNLIKVDGSLEYGISNVEDNIRFGSKYTNYLKYKVLDEDLKDYDWSTISYGSYDNKYKMIDSNLIKEVYDAKMPKYSYSGLKTYFSCPFNYYADRFLKLNEFDSTISTRLGKFSHGVLEDSYGSDFDFDESAKKNTIKESLDAKDRFYFKQMEEVLKELIKFNQERENASSLSNIRRELEINVKYDNYIFFGFVDKLMYAEIDGEIYAAIIDYKSGTDKAGLDNVEYGFHLQLPSYMLLLNNYEPFKGKKIHILGIYLQKVNIIALDNTKDIVAQRRDSFLLQGFTLSNLSLVKILDPTFEKSQYIKSLSVKKDGTFSNYAKVISEADEDYLVDLVNGLVKSADSNIRNARFDISPKKIDGNDQSCTYCKYKDLCFKQFEDIVFLDSKPFPKKEEE